MSFRNFRIMFCMELKKMWNDKLEFLILVFGAILLCLVYGSVSYTSPKNIDIVAFTDTFSSQNLFQDQETENIIQALNASPFFSVTDAYSRDDAISRLNRQKCRAVIGFQEDADGLTHIEVFLDPTDLTIQQIISRELSLIVGSQAKLRAAEQLSTLGISTDYSQKILNPVRYRIGTNAWRVTNQFDNTASPLIALIVLGVCLFTSITAVTSERSSGTIERLFATPFNRSEIILSKALARSVLALIASLVILITLKLVFDITTAKPALALFTAFLIGINGVAFGLLISSITRIELESVSLGITFWFIFITLMGFMWPLETMHPLLQRIAALTPYFHGVIAMRHINLVGWALDQALPSLTLLTGFFFLQLFCSSCLLKRKIN